MSVRFILRGDCQRIRKSLRFMTPVTEQNKQHECRHDDEGEECHTIYNCDGLLCWFHSGLDTQDSP